MTKTGIRAMARQGTAIAVAGLAGLALTTGATAAEAPRDEVQDGAEMAQAQIQSGVASSETVNVTGRREPRESPKYTAPLLDTPQTITIIDSGTIRGQNLLTLREILSTAPGITFGAGEGGGGYGDSINLRGYAANSDITVDGVRDSAQYTRTDPFNLEQIELINGANSVYGGSGSLGGSINIVSKTPHGRNESIVTGVVGTDDYYRGALDADYVIADGVALRLNLMGHANDVPGRDVEKYERWGFAPSVVFGLDSPTSLTLSFLHQEDENVPQYGVPYYTTLNLYATGSTVPTLVPNDGPLPGVNPSNYYGYSNIDRQESVIDQMTLKISHDFNDWLSVRNLTRYQEVAQTTVVNPPQGTWCLGGGLQAGAASCASVPAGFYIPSGPRGSRRDTENTLFYNQTDFSSNFETGSLKHTLVFGFSFSAEDYHLETGNVQRNPGGATPNPALPPMNIANPDTTYTGPVNFIRSGISDGELNNRAVYLFDTVEITPQWEFNAGVRYERVEGEFKADTLSTSGVVTPGTTFRSADDLLSYRFGIVFKPVEDGSIYFAYGNTETPSQASVNGGCTALTCDVDPESGEIFELGVKWNLMDDRLLLSAAVFQNERTNYKVASNDPTEPAQTLDGASRVRGLTLSATGSITDDLTIFANYTYLDSEVIQGVSDFCVENPLEPGCFGATTPLAGNPLTNTPKHSGSFWLTYELPAGFTVGYGISYQGEFFLTNGAGTLYTSDDYWVHSAMVSYEATEDLMFQLNVKNLFDEEYYIRVRNNGWAVPGDTLSATLSASYTF